MPILTIDRSKPFDLVAFLGERWSIVEQDERSLALTEIDLAKVELATVLREGKPFIKGEEKLRRLKQDGRICLDAAVFQALWENQGLIPEEWKEKDAVYFDGTILLDPSGDRYVLCLYWDGGRWDWYCDWLGSDWCVGEPSVVLVS